MSRYAGLYGHALSNEEWAGFARSSSYDGSHGLTLLWRTPHVVFFGEARAAFAHHQPSGAALIGDIRLDDRQALARELSLGVNLAETPDADLFLASYLRWGEECLERVRGDFAFAIYDPTRCAVFCARDPFGVKPFFYRMDRDRLWFGSDTKNLGPQSRRRLNEMEVLRFVAGDAPTGENTVYLDSLRLLAGRRLWAQQSAITCSPFYELRPTAIDGDPAEIFRELFTASVNQRLRGAKSPGAMLSGGLDSSSIAVVAAQLLGEEGGLNTFSRVFDDTPQWNERRFIEAVVAHANVKPTLLPSDLLDPFADLDTILEEQDGPFLAPGLALSRPIYKAATRAETDVLLDGHGGDEVVSHGWGRLGELARRGRFIKLWAEAKGISGAYNDPPHQIAFRALMQHAGARALIKGARRARRLMRGAAIPETRSPARYLNPETAAENDFEARWRADALGASASGQDERNLHRAMLIDPLQPYAMEVLHQNASALGVDARYPFWNRRLIEFCLGLEAKHKLDGGWSRLVLRRSMEGLLPPEVQWRRDKLDFSPHLVGGLLHHSRPAIESALEQTSSRLGDFVNLPEIRKAYERMRALGTAADGWDVQTVWRTVVLARWLEQSARPVDYEMRSRP